MLHFVILILERCHVGVDTTMIMDDDGEIGTCPLTLGITNWWFTSCCCTCYMCKMNESVSYYLVSFIHCCLFLVKAFMIMRRFVGDVCSAEWAMSRHVLV